MATTTLTLWTATAYFGSRAGGHVAFGRTREECARRAASSAGTIRIRRERTPTDAATVARLVAVGKLDAE